MVDTPVVQGFSAVQNGTKVDPSFGSVVGGLMGSGYKNLVKPPIEAIQNLAQNMGGQQGQYVNGNYLPMNPQEMTQNASEIGMLGMVGSGMMAPTNSLGMFGGKMAKMFPNRDDALRRVDVLNEAIDKSGVGILERKNLPEFAERKELRQYLKDTKPAKKPRKVVEEPKGLMSGVSEYVGSHQAPSMDYGTTIDDLAKMYPEDIYSRDGLQYYGNARNANDVESYKKLMAVKGKPDADVTVYRAVPKGVDSINQGDWITLSESYAKQHGDSVLNGDYDIIKTTAKAKDIVTDANDFNELGYWGKPVGGKESTTSPDERAENFKNWFGDSKVVDDAGEPITLYHGTDKDFDFFDRGKVQERFPFSFGTHLTNDPTEASTYADSIANAAVDFDPTRKFSKPTREGAAVYPVNASAKNPLVINTDQPIPSMEADLNRSEIIKQIVASRKTDNPYDSVIIKTPDGQMNVITFEPEQVKSIFNRGTYNPTDPNIMRGGLMAPIPQGENNVR